MVAPSTFAFSLFERPDGSGTIAYKILGRRNKGTPLVLIHGMSAVGLVDWLPLAEVLGKTRPVLIFDNRNVGSSVNSPLGDKAKYTLEEMAGDVSELIKRVGWKTVNILGFSMGGMIAQTILVTPHLPYRISHAVLVATSAKAPHSDLLGAMTSPSSVPLTLEEKIALTTPFIHIGYTTDFINDSSNDALLKRRVLESITARRPAKQIVRQLDAIAAYDVRKRLPSVSSSLPILLIHGKLDRSVYYSEQAYITKGLPHAVIAKTPSDNYAHAWYDYFGTDFWTGLLDDFFEDREPRPLPGAPSVLKAKL